MTQTPASQQFRVIVRQREPDRPHAALRCDCAGGCAGGVSPEGRPSGAAGGLDRETLGLTEVIALPTAGVESSRGPAQTLR
jgi:hypothetical protein